MSKKDLTGLGLYELDAGWHAGLAADHLLDQGDLDGFNVWVKIARMVCQLQQQKQPGEVLRH